MCLTMIDPASSWFEMAELPVKEVQESDSEEMDKFFDKTARQISILVNNTWFSRYPCPIYVIYDTRFEFKAQFQALFAEYALRKTPYFFWPSRVYKNA